MPGRGRRRCSIRRRSRSIRTLHGIPPPHLIPCAVGPRCGAAARGCRRPVRGHASYATLSACPGARDRSIHEARQTVMTQTRPPRADDFLDTLPPPSEWPDARGRFGRFGGQYAPETLMPALAELEVAYHEARNDPAFLREMGELRRHYVGRPTPMYHARALSERLGGAQIWLKREDLAHTGAHKINNALGQGLLAKRMGKPRIIAETGAGQHGVASATACALLDLECVVYMGAEDVRRQQPNVQRMRMLGAEVVAVEAGARTPQEAVSEAIRDWVSNVATSHYIIGSAVGPAPYPAMVRDLQRVIGDEARAQILERRERLPDRVLACVGGGSNAIGT